MLEVVLYIILFLSLILIIYQDLKFRHIHIVLPILLFCSGLWLTIEKDHFIVKELYYTIGFIVLNFVVLTIYFSIKNKSFLNPFKYYVGLGDLMYLLAVAPLFVFRAYVLYFVLGMVFSLILYMAFKKRYRTKETIPLAGYLSLFLMILLTSDVLFNSQFLNSPIF